MYDTYICRVEVLEMDSTNSSVLIKPRGYNMGTNLHLDQFVYQQEFTGHLSVSVPSNSFGHIAYSVEKSSAVTTPMEFAI